MWNGTYEYSGAVSDFTESIGPGQAGFVVASKSEGSGSTGAVGSFRYLLGNTGKSFEIMYSVPFDYNLYSNLFNGNIVNSTSGPSRSSYDNAYKHSYYAGKDVADEKQNGYRFRMTMTNKGQSQMRVTIE